MADPGDVDGRVYYSTPFGDTNDGRRQVFLLQRDGVSYVPVFRSVESMQRFYTRMNRAAYMVIEGSVESVLETNRSIDLLRNAGVVIEPLSENPVVVTPDG